jgi:hypothetical protein
MAEQPVNLSTAIFLGVFSRAEQRVLQAISKAIAEGGGRCVATHTMLARDSNAARQPRATRSPKRSQSAFWKRPNAALETAQYAISSFCPTSANGLHAEKVERQFLSLGVAEGIQHSPGGSAQ